MHFDIDVLLPFHNVDRYFFEALDSLSASKNVNIRLILIDDTIAQNFQPKTSSAIFKKIELIRTGGSKGYGEALKYGSQLISSEIVGLSNSDDLISSLRFKKQIPVLEHSDLSITGLQRISPNGKKIGSLVGNIKSSQFHNLFLLLGSYGANASWVMRRTWWDNNVFFDNDECLDWRIALKTFEDTKVDWNPEKLYMYRKHKNQVTDQNNLIQLRMDIVYKAWQSLADKYGLSNNSKENFYIYATPWLKRPIFDLDSAENWKNDLTKLAKSTNKEVHLVVSKILKRRQIFALVNHPQISFLKYRSNYSTISEAPKLIYDYVRSLRK
jgi:hypothetical protein